MKKIILSFSNKSKRKEYPIFIGNHLMEKIASLYDFSNYSRVFIVTDQNIKPLFLKTLMVAVSINATFFTLTPGEKEKHVGNIQKIWKAMHEAQCDRKSLVINLGGGVVGDMGGFAASTYMRGIDFLNIPTTLLAQVDASVGGKTGIDFSGIKNLVGTFDQPKAIIVDVQTMATLPKREFLSGFAEIIKHGLIKDRRYFAKVTSKHPLEFNQNELLDIIKRSCEIKAEIVESDETENGQRKLLNFGHTIGHAIEALSLETNRPLLHGEAISVGMVAAAKISQRIGFLSNADVEIIQQSLQNADLPIRITGIATDTILKKIKSDKKNEKGKINLTLLQSIGKGVYNQNISEAEIIKAIKYIQKRK